MVLRNGLVSALAVVFVFTGCGSKKDQTPVVLNPNEPGETALELKTPEELGKILTVFTEETRQMIRSGKVSVSLKNPKEFEAMAENVCAKETSISCKENLREEIAFAYVRSIASMMVNLHAHKFQTAGKKVWLKDSRKSKPAFEFYNRKYANRYLNGINQVLIVVTDEVTQGSSAKGTAGQYISSPTEQDNDRLEPLWLLNEAIKDLKPGFTSDIRFSAAITTKNVHLIYQRAHELLFGASHVIFIERAAYERADTSYNAIVVHELKHYLDLTYETRNFNESAFDGDYYKKRAEDEKLAEKELAEIIKTKGFAAYIAPVHKEVRKFVQNTSDQEEKIKAIERNLIEFYTANFNENYAYYNIRSERRAYVEEAAFLRQAGITLGEFIEFHADNFAFIDSDGNLHNNKPIKRIQDEKNFSVFPLISNFEREQLKDFYERAGK